MDSTAVTGKRIAAYAIDAILGTIVWIASFVALAEQISTPFDLCAPIDSALMCIHTGDTVYITEGWAGVAVFTIAIGFWLLMGWLVQGLTGGTPGKLIVGLRVVDQNTGRLAGLSKCLGRTLMWVADGQPLGLPLVGLITGVSTKGHRRVGDMVANTLVVDKGAVGNPPYVPGLLPVATFAPVPPGGTYFSAPPGSSYPPPPGAVPIPQAETHSTGDDVDSPKWDADRGAYIQWDKQKQIWMIYEDATSQWRELI